MPSMPPGAGGGGGGDVGDHGFRHEQEAGDGGGVFEGAAGDLGRVDDARLEHVDVFAGGDVVAVGAGAVADVADDDGAVDAGVLGQLPQRGFAGAADDLDADAGVAVELDVLQGGLGADEGDAAAGDDAFLDRGAGGVEGVFDAGLLFLHLGLGGGADVDDGDAAGELGAALLELLAIVVGGGLVNLAGDLVDAGLDGGGVVVVGDDGGVLLVDGDPLGAAEVGQRDGFELEAEVVRQKAAGIALLGLPRRGSRRFAKSSTTWKRKIATAR